MNNTLKDGLSFEVAHPQSTEKPTPNDRLAKLLAGRTRVRLETDENGYAVVDKEKHLRLYEWVVKG